MFKYLLIYCFYVFRCEYSTGTGECVEEDGKKEEGKSSAVYLNSCVWEQTN